METKVKERNQWARKHKDHNRTWHTFQSIKKNNIRTHSHNIFIFIYIYIYAYKTPKTEDVGHCLASLWLKLTANNVFFRLLWAVCREAQDARPSQPGHVHELPPQERGEETLLNWYRTWARPKGHGQIELPCSEASASILGLLLLMILNSLPLYLGEGKRMENQEVGGH